MEMEMEGKRKDDLQINVTGTFKLWILSTIGILAYAPGARMWAIRGVSEVLRSYMVIPVFPIIRLESGLLFSLGFFSL